MNDNELTAEDFIENDLPHRPLKYSPRHRTELRRFGMLCVGIFVLLFGVALLL